MSARVVKIQLRLPSAFGYEKVAMVSAAEAAGLLGFPQERIDDLKTAVAEVCINAIEHGNRCRPRLPVDVEILLGTDSLQVRVTDRGQGVVVTDTEPCLEEQVAGRESTRGWGLFLSRRLADELQIDTRRGSGTVTTLLFRRTG